MNDEFRKLDNYLDQEQPVTDRNEKINVFCQQAYQDFLVDPFYVEQSNAEELRPREFESEHFILIHFVFMA